MDLQLRALESPDNFKNLITKITAKYKIDPNTEQNIINIKSYLRTLNGKLLLDVYKTAPAVNDIIINRFGEYINEKSSIPDGLEATRNYLLNTTSIINENTAAVIIPREVVNIDTIEDLHYANYLFTKINKVV